MGGKTRSFKSSSKCCLVSACLWGHFGMNEETAQNEAHIKLGAFGRNLFSPGSRLTAKGRHLPVRQNWCHGILPLPCLCFPFGEEAKCWSYHSNTYRGFSPDTTYHGTWRTFVGSAGGCTLLRKFKCADFLVMLCCQEMHGWYLLESTRGNAKRSFSHRIVSGICHRGNLYGELALNIKLI